MKILGTREFYSLSRLSIHCLYYVKIGGKYEIYWGYCIVQYWFIEVVWMPFKKSKVSMFSDKNNFSYASTGFVLLNAIWLKVPVLRIAHDMHIFILIVLILLNSSR